MSRAKCNAYPLDSLALQTSQCFDLLYLIHDWTMGAGGYVGETREAGRHTLWSSAWSGAACPPFVNQRLSTGRAQRAEWSRSDHPHIHGVKNVHLKRILHHYGACGCCQDPHHGPFSESRSRSAELALFGRFRASGLPSEEAQSKRSSHSSVACCRCARLWATIGNCAISRIGKCKCPLTLSPRLAIPIA